MSAKKEFKGQTISFIVSEDCKEIAFTLHSAAEGTDLQDVNYLGHTFIYSVLGAGIASSRGGQVNADGSMTINFRL